jgi:outer membrane cobalamin receptor
MKPKIDINLGASYLVNSWFTAFAKVNNLINNSYQYYYGYDVQGFNVLVGGAFSF